MRKIGGGEESRDERKLRERTLGPEAAAFKRWSGLNAVLIG